MLNIRDLRIDPASLGEKMLLVEITPTYEYKNGTKTTNVLGYRYTVALPKHNLEKLGVKIDGKQLMDKPEGFVEVEFENLEVSAYEKNGSVFLTAKATDMESVDLSKISHILLGGSTGSGKSILLKVLLVQSLKKNAIVSIADFKGGVDFPRVWHDKCKMCFDEDTLFTAYRRAGTAKNAV